MIASLFEIAVSLSVGLHRGSTVQLQLSNVTRWSSVIGLHIVDSVWPPRLTTFGLVKCSSTGFRSELLGNFVYSFHNFTGSVVD